VVKNYDGETMSFVCLKCGWRDDPRWRNTYFDPHTVLMNWTDFKELYPEMADKFNRWAKTITEGPYAYERLPKSKWPPKYIVRGIIEEWKARGGTFHLTPGFLDGGVRKLSHTKSMQMFANFRKTREASKTVHPKEKIKNW
jgi:hypothetical protein